MLVIPAGLDGGLSIAAFQELLAEKTGVAPPQQEILTGFPPAPIQLPAEGSGSLGDLPISNGDTIVVRRGEGAAEAAQQPAVSAASTQPAQHSAEQLAQVPVHFQSFTSNHPSLMTEFISFVCHAAVSQAHWHALASALFKHACFLSVTTPARALILHACMTML